jgi:hypothetical protein
LISSATYKLLDIDEIRYWAEDSLIKLNIVTQSQVKREIKADAQELADKINRILALSELWLQVQNKVRRLIQNLIFIYLSIYKFIAFNSGYFWREFLPILKLASDDLVKSS